jgi:Cupin superfamily protein
MTQLRSSTCSLGLNTLAVFCRQLDAVLCHPTQANAYLTPPSAQGLPLHHDTHDVFVLQLSGSKQWQIYQPAVELPLRHQWSSSQDRPAEEPSLSLTMRKGDALYLPRGWLHEAITTSDESLHLTIGVHAYTWMDALKDAILDCDTEVQFRRAVRPDGMAEADLLGLVASRLGPAEVAMRMRRRFVGTRRPIYRGQLGQLRDLAHASTRSLFQRRFTVIADLDIKHEQSILRFKGKQLVFPSQAHDALRSCYSATTPFVAADLPGLDDEGQMVLVRRLVLEGFLDVVELS